MRTSRLVAAAVAGLSILAACGGTEAGDGTVAETIAPAETAADTTAGDTTQGEALEVVAQDYAFQGVPDAVPPGTELTLTNSSAAEVHEMVVVHIAAGEERPLEELLELPDEESESLVQFQGVLVALPEEDGVNPEGEGDSITVSEPGRYAIVCFIPQGADPAVVEEAMTSDEAAEGPPDMGDGTPHAFLGMVDEFTVEG